MKFADIQGQTTVAAHLESEQLLLFDCVRQGQADGPTNLADGRREIWHRDWRWIRGRPDIWRQPKRGLLPIDALDSQVTLEITANW